MPINMSATVNILFLMIGMSVTGNFEVSKVKNSVIEAIGCLAPLLSDERLYKYTASPVCSTLLSMTSVVDFEAAAEMIFCTFLPTMSRGGFISLI